jgi:NADH:ubiquinone oxidoreductase subunit E
MTSVRGQHAGTEWTAAQLGLPEAVVQFYKARRPHYPTNKALLVPVLMECQKQLGSISEETQRAVAQLLGVTRGEVQSVLSFYVMLLEQPSGRYLIGVCDTWNCEAAGAHGLVHSFCHREGVELLGVTGDGLFTIMEMECYCDCHNAPSLQFMRRGDSADGDFRFWWVNNVTPEIFKQICDDVRREGDAGLRERLVRVEKKQNPPDDRLWVWLVTTNNQYPCWVENKGGEFIVHDGFAKLAGLKERNPKLHSELQAALKEVR